MSISFSEAMSGYLSDNDIQLEVTTPSVYTPTGTTQAIDLSVSQSHKTDLESATGDVTVTFSNGVVGKSYVIEVIQDSTTPRNITWTGGGVNVDFQGGASPTISTGAEAEDLFTLYCKDTDSYNMDLGQDYK